MTGGGDAYAQLLTRAGLEIVGDGRAGDVLPTWVGTHLLRYADDPESTAELVERFSRDPDEEVRARAASDPRLSAASAVRLVDDPRWSVRHQAAGHPRLPARTLIGLLRDRERARVAAGNPALPVAVMHGMIDARESSVRG
ncbi:MULTISPECIES: hypothetical protein [unclassified Streptomyces]|uniref:hypothetical protein n=1 Tax=unclassified Streptomyces TaxID=2593676 RepID=UPI00332E7B92